MEGQIRKWSLGLNPVKSVKTVLVKQSSADNRKKIKLQGSSKRKRAPTGPPSIKPRVKKIRHFSNEAVKISPKKNSLVFSHYFIDTKSMDT